MSSRNYADSLANEITKNMLKVLASFGDRDANITEYYNKLRHEYPKMFRYAESWTDDAAFQSCVRFLSRKNYTFVLICPVRVGLTDFGKDVTGVNSK